MKRRKLKIAMAIASELPFPIPKDFPRLHAPTQVALDIAEGLSKKGHKVTFFGPIGSKSKSFNVFEAPIVPLYKNKIFKKTQPKNAKDKVRIREVIFNLFDQFLLLHLFRENLKRKFDIIHIHCPDRALPFASLFKTPVVYSWHYPIAPWEGDLFKMYQTKNQYFVSLSNAQRKPAPDLNWIETVYNGIRLESFPFNPKPKNNLLFLGRLFEKKGVDIAVKVALKLKENLIIAGEPNKGEFWEKKIKPYLGRNIKYVGCVPHKETYRYYKQARALLCPIKWEEPFGLTFIEAMACGTPVIAFKRGSVPEVIKDGKTGFIVEPFDKRGKPNLKGFIEVVKKIDQIDRRECRRWVEKNFTVEKMVDGYERVYEKILKREN